jgi:predicted DCC family thiol-disulfide oxidoreductase YuxK
MKRRRNFATETQRQREERQGTKGTRSEKDNAEAQGARRLAEKEEIMITLADEFTDRKEKTARGWLFFDAECRFCTRMARWIAPILLPRGLGVAPLQDPRVGALLGMKREELLTELRFLLSDGTNFGGARAVVAVAREIWWARSFVWLAALPGMMPVLDAGYEWIAERRGCVSHTCELRSRS